MKKILLFVVVTAQCDIHAMWFEEKIKKILPKHSYVLSATVRKTTDEEKTVTETKGTSPKNIGETSFATSITAANNEEFSLILSDIEQSPSELTITSSVSNNSNTSTSSYISMIANRKIHEEKILTSIGNARLLPDFSEEKIIVKNKEASRHSEKLFSASIASANSEKFSSILSYIKQIPSEMTVTYNISNNNNLHTSDQTPNQTICEEEIFDMEMPDGEQPSSETISKEYFPTYSREKQICDIRKSNPGTSYNPMRRRKSNKQSFPGYTESKEYFPPNYHEKQIYDTRYNSGTSYNPTRRRKSSLDVYFHGYK